jgi:hypothetical protein
MTRSVLLCSTALTLGLLGGSAAFADVDPSKFDAAALTQAPEVVSCTLENGSAADCVELHVSYKPEALEIGPFCPATVEESGGIWDWDGENEGLYRLNASFFTMLTELGFKFVDEDGNILISNPGAGMPTDPNTCLEAVRDEAVDITALIPITPVKADEVIDLGTVAKVGMALDGVPIFADAPSVLQTGHLPALDTCGGHIDPGGWYHWHATSTDIDTAYDYADVAASCMHVAQDSSAQFGYAFDGYPMFGTTDENGNVPTDLDECNGRISSDGTYGYYATAEFPNLPPCLTGVVAENNFSTTAKGGIGAEGGPQGGGHQGGDRQDGGQGLPPGFEEAANALGVSAEALLMALQDAGAPQNLDIDAAAASLGVSADDLQAAMPKRP